MLKLKSKILLLLAPAVLTACASSQIKARKEQRDKVVQTSHLYCEFVNGEQFPDVEVEVNLEIAKHCDSQGPLTLTNYRSPSDAIGLVYCCATKDEDSNAEKTKPTGKADKKSGDKKSVPSDANPLDSSSPDKK